MAGLIISDEKHTILTLILGLNIVVIVDPSAVMALRKLIKMSGNSADLRSQVTLFLVSFVILSLVLGIPLLLSGDFDELSDFSLFRFIVFNGAYRHCAPYPPIARIAVNISSAPNFLANDPSSSLCGATPQGLYE